MEVYTSSRARAFRMCRRLHQIRYIERVVPRVEALPLTFGTLLHAGLERWWVAQKEKKHGKDPGDPLSLAHVAMDLKLGAMSSEHEVDGFMLMLARVLMAGYHRRWLKFSEDPGLQVIAVEKSFSCPLINPETGRASRTFTLAGKLDVIVSLDGAVWIVEHKTSADDIMPGSMYWQKLRIDGQVSTYYEGATALGLPPVGCVYDVIKKPLVRPLLATPEESRKWRKDGKLYATQRLEDETIPAYAERVAAKIIEDPNAFYQHGDVIRTETDIDEFRKDTWMTASSMRESMKLGCHPRNPDACYMYRRLCQYWDVCTGAADLDDTGRFRRLGWAHPELRQGDVLPQPSTEKPKEEADDAGNGHDSSDDAGSGEDVAS